MLARACNFNGSDSVDHFMLNTYEHFKLRGFNSLADVVQREILLEMADKSQVGGLITHKNKELIIPSISIKKVDANPGPKTFPIFVNFSRLDGGYRMFVRNNMRMLVSKTETM